MQQLLLIVHFFFAIFLIVLVLIQRGKGADIGAAFGSGASQTVFGSKGSVGFLMKLTFGIGAIFFATSIMLTYLAANDAKAAQKSTVLTNIENIAKEVQSQPQEVSAPAVQLKKPNATSVLTTQKSIKQ